MSIENGCDYYFSCSDCECSHCLVVKQRTEIERLTEENKRLSIKVWSYEQPARTPLYSNESMVNCNFVTCYNENADLKAKNAELQKQVDELKTENTELYKEHTTVIAGSILQKKQAVRDTAKEICDDLRNIFIEQSSYGSDANQHIGYYDYEVKMGLVIEQIEEYAKEKYGIEYGVEVE